ncbi:MAG: CIA30 family protein [Litorimonas sp.]
MSGQGACSASATDGSVRAQQQQSCTMNIAFSDPEAIAPWQIVNDGVMGGRSQGTRFAQDGHMVFRGVINTNGGGFSSLRRRMSPGDLSGTTGLRLKVRSDGRDYKLTFRTSERWRGRSVSYQASIPATPAGDWAEVTVPFADMRTSIFGRAVRADPFDPSDVREMGIIIADGIDGAFQLEVQNLSCITEA